MPPSTPTEVETQLAFTPTPEDEPVAFVNPDAPEMIYLDTPYSASAQGIPNLDGGQLSVMPSPVGMELYWDYNPYTGKMGFSSEFFYSSGDDSLVPISDLWVYDFQTGEREMWLSSNVRRAVSRPDGQSLAVSLFNQQTRQLDIALVTGPNQITVLAECASMSFSWSPDGSQIAYLNFVETNGISNQCSAGLDSGRECAHLPNSTHVDHTAGWFGALFSAADFPRPQDWGRG